MGINNLKKQIRNKDIGTLYLFYGSEEYLKKYYVNSIEKLLLDKNLGDMNKIIIDGKTGVSKIIDSCETLPVFSDRKLILVKNSDFFKTGGKKEETGRLADYLEDVPTYVCLIFYEEDVDKRLKAYKTINKKGLVVEFSYQKPADLARWIIKIGRAYNKSIEESTAKFLVERLGQEMTEILNEIQKLIAYAGEREVITIEDAKEVCSIPIKSRIFDLTDAILAGDAEDSFKYLNDMLALKEPIPMIIFMIARQFRQLLQAKVLTKNGASGREIGTELKVPPYIAGKIQKQSHSFTLQSLNRIMEKIFECDLSIKTGKMKEKVAVELLVAQLLEH